MHENWFKDGVRFECTKCGKCCTVPQHSPVSQFSNAGAAIAHEEVSILAQSMNLDEEAFREKYVTTSRTGYQALRIVDGACVFYDAESKLCKVHEQRPSHCHAYPFHWNMHAKMFWDGAKAQCEGINEGELIPESAILARLAQRKPEVYPHGNAPVLLPEVVGEIDASDWE